MVKVIVDTSVFIEKIRTNNGLFDDLIKKTKEKRVELYTSTIILTELWMGESMDRVKSEEHVESLLKLIKVIVIDSKIAKKAGELIRNKLVGGFDALVGATAIVYGAKLATLNRKHFEKIKGLKLY